MPFEIQADKEAVQRYGQEAATEFATIKSVQTALIDAFDQLALECTSIYDAAEASYAFDYIWALLDDKRKQVLETLDVKGGE